MKVIIAGSREITSYSIVEKAVRDSGFDITEVVSGTARGVDRLGEEYAKTAGIPIKKFPADWSIGKSAGYKRNKQMGKYADAAIIVRKDMSRGSSHMHDIMLDLGKLVYLVDL